MDMVTSTAMHMFHIFFYLLQFLRVLARRARVSFSMPVGARFGARCGFAKAPSYRHMALYVVKSARGRNIRSDCRSGRHNHSCDHSTGKRDKWGRICQLDFRLCSANSNRKVSERRRESQKTPSVTMPRCARGRGKRPHSLLINELEGSFLYFHIAHTLLQSPFHPRQPVSSLRPLSRHHLFVVITLLRETASLPGMMAVVPPCIEEIRMNESLAHYSKSLHEYTLRLWTESRRKAEQQAQARSKAPSAMRKLSERVQRR